MSEIWIAAAATVVGGALSGMGAEKKAKEDRKASRELTQDSARYEALLSAFETEQDYYYNQLNRANKQRGLEQFRQFSTIKQFAPQYAQTSPGVVVPEKPVIPTFNSQKDVSAGNVGYTDKGQRNVATPPPYQKTIDDVRGAA